MRLFKMFWKYKTIIYNFNEDTQGLIDRLHSPKIVKFQYKSQAHVPTGICMPLLVIFEFQWLPMARTLGPDRDLLGPDRDLHKNSLTLLKTLLKCWELVGNEIMSYNSYNWIVLSINMTSEDGLEL